MTKVAEIKNEFQVIDPSRTDFGNLENQLKFISEFILLQTIDSSSVLKLLKDLKSIKSPFVTRDKTLKLYATPTTVVDPTKFDFSNLLLKYSAKINFTKLMFQEIRGKSSKFLLLNNNISNEHKYVFDCAIVKDRNGTFYKIEFNHRQYNLFTVFYTPEYAWDLLLKISEINDFENGLDDLMNDDIHVATFFEFENAPNGILNEMSVEHNRIRETFNKVAGDDSLRKWALNPDQEIPPFFKTYFKVYTDFFDEMKSRSKNAVAVQSKIIEKNNVVKSNISPVPLRHDIYIETPISQFQSIVKSPIQVIKVNQEIEELRQIPIETKKDVRVEQTIVPLKITPVQSTIIHSSQLPLINPIIAVDEMKPLRTDPVEPKKSISIRRKKEISEFDDDFTSKIPKK
jgi:hypothetical protein